MPLAITWMDLERNILSEISQMKTSIILYHFYVESKNDTKEFIYKIEIDSQTENKLMAAGGNVVGKRQLGSLVWTCTHCCILNG